MMLELGETSANAAPLISDGSEATFMQDVIEASSQVPVIVDFWAPWCGPCKTLGPALEAAVTEARGKVRLVKIDVDQNQMLAQQMQVQSIPAVFAFVGGRPVDGFMGNQTPSQIKEFVEKLGAQSPQSQGVEEVLDAADAALSDGATADAAQAYAAVLAEEPQNLRAIAGMARAYAVMGELEEASQILEMVPEDKAGHPAVAAACAEIELAQAAASGGETGALRAAVEAAPDDHQARLDLAIALTGEREYENAINELLELFRRDREWNEEAAKNQLFTIFDALGPADPLTKSGRRRLTSMIFL